MTKRIVSMVVMLVIILGLLALAIFGVEIGSFQIASALDEENGIRRGLDLVGGSVITFEADLVGENANMAGDELSTNMSIAQSILQQRLIVLGFTEAQVAVSGDRRIRVEIPDVKDPEEAVQLLGSTAKLTFQDANGKVLLEGSDILSATAAYGAITQMGLPEHHIQLEFQNDSKAKFTEATKQVASMPTGQNYMAIALDGEPINDEPPYVDASYATSGMAADNVVISGDFDEREARELAGIINAGQLPFNLKQVEMRSVGPQLGERALETSLLAGLIGIIMVIIFMIAIYRLPGVVAAVSLVFYISIIGLVLSLLRVNLSLPGIAGVILSIGMAVDANVVIFERIKEELRLGKTVKSAIDSGFHRALTAVVDSNITTLIAAIVLYFSNVATIVGFAITLGIGIIVSMFTAIVVTRFFLNRISDFNTKSIKVYGA